jgi:hypothetical protein
MKLSFNIQGKENADFEKCQGKKSFKDGACSFYSHSLFYSSVIPARNTTL